MSRKIKIPSEGVSPEIRKLFAKSNSGPDSHLYKLAVIFCYGGSIEYSQDDLSKIEDELEELRKVSDDKSRDELIDSAFDWFYPYYDMLKFYDQLERDIYDNFHGTSLAMKANKQTIHNIVDEVFADMEKMENRS